MKNMSKTNKEKLLKMDLQMFAADPNLTTMDDLGEIKSIDFVNRFEAGIQELLELIGVTRKQELTQDLLIQMYEWDVTLEDGTVAEGDTIPLSKATRAKGRTAQVTWQKRRRAVSAEAIARHGAARAITEADNKILRKIQGVIKSDFITFLGTAPTKNSGEGLQQALANAWGTLNTFEEFDGEQFVSFVNPLDVAAYLGETKVLADASNMFGMTLLKNFLGANNVIVLNAIPQGMIYSTAIENIVLAYLNMRTSDVGEIFADFVDETGFISATRGRVLSNATYESLFMNAIALFPEIPEGVVATTITAPAATTTE